MHFKPENVDFTWQFGDPSQMDGKEVVENVRLDIGMSASLRLHPSTHQCIAART